MADKKIIPPEDAFNWAHQILNQANPTTSVAQPSSLQSGPTILTRDSQSTEVLRKSYTSDLQKVVFSDSQNPKKNNE